MRERGRRRGEAMAPLASAILASSPRTRVVLFDQPAVVEGAARRLRADGIAERCTCVGGDFFAAVPAGADTYVVKDIIHHRDDERAASILRNCRARWPLLPLLPDCSWW